MLSPESNNLQERNLGLHEQFRHPKKIETVDGPLMIHEIIPENDREIPVFISSGFTQGADTIEPIAVGLADKGDRRVIFPDLPHGNPSSVRDRELWNESEYHHGKAMTIIKTLEEIDISKTDIVGHSEGCISIIFAAALYPEKFRNIVLVNPAGLIGKDSLLATAKRFLKNLRVSAEQVKQDQAVAEVSKLGKPERDGNFKKDLKKTYNSAKSITMTELEEIMAIVVSKGIKISIIHTEDDNIFPLERVKAMNDRYAKKNSFDKDFDPEKEKLVDHFYTVSGIHNDFYLKPEVSTTNITKALDTMDKE
ncbi:MAG: alpha/beta hydrolase [Candidatus Magasanikbacteria bacterium]